MAPLRSHLGVSDPLGGGAGGQVAVAVCPAHVGAAGAVAAAACADHAGIAAGAAHPTGAGTAVAAPLPAVPGAARAQARAVVLDVVPHLGQTALGLLTQHRTCN